MIRIVEGLRECVRNGGTRCPNCSKGMIALNCQVGAYRYYAHKLSKKDIVQAARTGDISYIKKAIELYAPWKLGELEKLLVLI